VETPLETGFCSSSFEAGDEFGWSMEKGFKCRDWRLRKHNREEREINK